MRLMSVTPDRSPRIRRRGFTLVELLVVIGIIALLSSILFPVFSKARQQALATKCSSNLRQIGTAVQMYLNENEQFLFQMRNNGRWTDPTTGQPIDPYDGQAYWGVPYADAG